ncbi:MAG: HEAT repeat domain-containing protein [Halodesulfurarchaeum sp.]
MTEDETERERLREASGADGVETVRDVTLGTARPEEYSAADTAPVADATVEDLLEMTHAESPTTRRRAVLALAERDPEPAARRRVTVMARTDPDAEVRQFAVEALAKLDGDPAVARDRIAADDDQWVRAEAVVALDRLDRTGHEETFARLLDDESAAVRRNALIALTRTREGEARETVIGALEDPDDRVREWAATLLGTLDDDPRVEEALRSIVTSPDEVDVVKEAAARSLGAEGEDVDALLDSPTDTRPVDEHFLNRMPDY